MNIFIILSVLIAFASPIFYFIAVVRGDARPHRTTRFVIMISTLLSTVSFFAHGDSVSVWLAGVSTVQAIVILLLSFKYGMGGWTEIDIVCLIIALIGVFFWYKTTDPLFAIYLSIISDFVGMIPSLIKTYKYPRTEVWIFYLLDTIAALCNLFALHVWSVDQYSYPLYLLIINFAMVILIIRPKVNSVLLVRFK